jgi:predicted CXXCH cytochrome family protein
MSSLTPYIRLQIGKRDLPCLIMGILLILLSGCSSTQNYKTLSFFFDGVPKTDIELTDQKLDSLARADSTALVQNMVSVQKPLMNYHSPYQEKDCASCHDQSTMGKFVSPQPELCYQCHDDFKNTYKVLHGPVAGGQCTACHNPHQSENENLLTRTGRSLCLYCHELNLIMSLEEHKEIQDANCTDCHNPHGGENKYNLR